jgi:amino acid transporter
MLAWLKRILIGKPLENEALHGEKYSVFWGLPILSSDAISSVAYATEEILLVLVPVVGLMAFQKLTIISCAIIALLAVLTISYRQTILSYPNGGGAYVVASDNLGSCAGVVAGSALAIGYTLTVAVSISAGTAAITSAIPSLLQYRVEVCLVILLLLFIGNLRGISESAKIFGVPAYLFMLAMISMIVVGFYKVRVLHFAPPAPPIANSVDLMGWAGILLMLRAFSSGCAALTGVEAVSNAVPNFKEPSVKHARTVLLLLSFVVLILFGGISVLANLYRVVPGGGRTVLAKIAAEIFGAHSLMFYAIQTITAFILALAANTAYSGFPLLISVMAKDGFAPRQLAVRGERLAYSNGITVLTVLAGILIIIFKGDTHLLIPLYAIGVFISFTLSQTGMFIRWIKRREKGWVHKALINGAGAVVTFITVIIVGATKFRYGAWIVFLVIPIMMAIMLKIKRHYISVAEQLRITTEEALSLLKETYHNHVIIPIDSINRASIRALRYAKTVSDRIVVFHVSIDEEEAKRMRERWDQLETDIPLVIKYSPYRKVIQPLLNYVESYEQYSYKKGDMITVVLPQFSVKIWWQIFLHNQTRLLISRSLLKHRHIVVATIPLQLKNDNEVLRRFSNKLL